MSMEQNEPQLSQGQPGPPAVPASTTADGGSNGSPNAQQQRRRRRRRKTGRIPGSPESQPQAATASLPGESSAEPGRRQGREPGQDSVTERAPDHAARDAAREPSREHAREQSREPRQPVAREVAAPEASREQRARQGRGQQPHGKKQQRQAKPGGGGSSQGRQFQKGGQPQPVRESNPGNGSGQPPAGARRKQKIRRAAPSFVGPMDHSYRVANGNIADGSPSTMDFRSNTSNGNGNGNVHGRNGYSDAEVTAPAILRDDAPVRIICFIEDLFVVAKMQETARKLGVKVSFVKAEKDTVARLTDMPESERPSLIVFDLNNANAKPLTLIPKLKAKLKRSTSIIGFLSHIQGDLKMKATEAGCDTVMPKAAFSQNLPNLLRRHGLDEEMEALEV